MYGPLAHHKVRQDCQGCKELHPSSRPLDGGSCFDPISSEQTCDGIAAIVIVLQTDTVSTHYSCNHGGYGETRVGQVSA